ncbi:helix-turn-helix domain-containing protein [Escherichia coli]|nr:helix-turn-helix domain-containing protein [Escherichia coli]
MKSKERIIDMHLQGYTQSEIARQIGVSRQRVNQVIKAHNMELDLLKAKAARRLADIVIEENERLKAFITKLVSDTSERLASSQLPKVAKEEAEN